MPTPSERLALLLKVHNHSYRDAGKLCDIDHTTIMRVDRGETENPATLAKIAEGYRVPVAWMRGDRHLTTDFAFDVLSRSLQERVLFLWERERRVALALNFLRQYAPETYTVDHLAELMGLSSSQVEACIAQQGHGKLSNTELERLSTGTGLPLSWFQAGLVGREDEEEMLVGLASHILTSLANKLGVDFSEEEIHMMAVALV